MYLTSNDNFPLDGLLTAGYRAVTVWVTGGGFGGGFQMKGNLTSLSVERAGVGMHGDGNCLWLIVTQLKDGSLSKRWLMRYRMLSAYREIPLGAYPAVSLATARVVTNQHHATIAAGGDPAQLRREAREAKKAVLVAAKTAINTKPLTFKRVVREYVDQFGKDKWRSARAAKAFINNLDNHVMPTLGNILVVDIDHEYVLKVFDKLYAHSPIMASRIRGVCESVMGFAIMRHRLAVSNPFAWKGSLEFVYRKKPASKNFAAVDYKTIPALFTQLIELGDDPAALAARLQIACALRPTEARLMKFEYIDATANTFTIPMTKNGRPFVVPINDAARDVIERAIELRTSDYMFAGRDSRSPIGERSLYTMINRLTGATAHGVARAGFSTWSYETQDWAPDHIIEASLHHTPDALVRAYKRGDLLELRRRLSTAWSDYLLSREGQVIQFPATKTA